jgi:lysophospholipase L1-like esterase
MTEPASDACRLGVLAFGDSITNAGGELQWGVALQSWALWIARALGLPYSGFAVDGAVARDVVTQQIPAFRQRTEPGARFDLGALYIGVNDVRALGWDPAGFAADHAAALAFLAQRCDRVLTLTAPRRLGRPSAGQKVAELNALVAANADRHGALVVDLSDFGARNHVMVDQVHPTAFGQIAIAERALAVLSADGLRARVAPHELIHFEPDRVGRLRGDVTYVYRDLRSRLRAWIDLVRLRRALARGGNPR